MNARKHSRGSRRPGGRSTRGGRSMKRGGGGSKGSGCGLFLFALITLPTLAVVVIR